MCCFIQNIHSQNAEKKVLEAKHILYPYGAEKSEAPSSKENSFSFALSRTKKFHYTLLSNFKSNKAIFYLDSLVTKPIKGKEKYRIDSENVFCFSYKKDGDYYQKEIIFKRPFFVFKNREFSYKWKLTNENKKIAGFNCTKAISNIRNFKVTAWFTNEILINYGPLNLYGLSGLIVQVETFFNTVILKSIKYLDNTDMLDEKIDKYKKTFNLEKSNNEIKGYILLLKKGELIQSLRNMKKISNLCICTLKQVCRE